MKLFLTSKAFEDENVNKKIRLNIGIDINKAKVMFIPTALSGVYNFDKYLPDLIRFGFKEENIIIFDEKHADDFKNLNIDVIYVCGGNTFTLLKLIKECKFDKALINYVNKGVIYIGRSAGTHLLTKNIEHVLNFDENTVGFKDFNALGIFNGIIFCHYSKQREKQYLKEVEKNTYNIYKITDEDVIIVEDNKVIL